MSYIHVSDVVIILFEAYLPNAPHVSPLIGYSWVFDWLVGLSVIFFLRGAESYKSMLLSGVLVLFTDSTLFDLFLSSLLLEIRGIILNGASLLKAT